MNDKLDIVRALSATALPLVGSAVAGSWYDQGNALTEWYDKLKRSKLTPPNWVFPVVWAYIYPSTGYASYLVWRAGGGFRGLAQGPLVLYAATLGFNWAFSPLFFGRRDVKAGFVSIIPLTLSVYACGYAFHNIDHLAGLLFVPYAAWCTFATYLAYNFWKLNPKREQSKKQ